jgi:hypothetical protein
MPSKDFQIFQQAVETFWKLAIPRILTDAIMESSHGNDKPLPVKTPIVKERT